MRLVFRCLLLYVPSRYEQAAHIGFRNRRFYMPPSGVHPEGILRIKEIVSLLLSGNVGSNIGASSGNTNAQIKSDILI